MNPSQPENLGIPLPPPEQAPSEPAGELLPAAPEKAASPARLPVQTTPASPIPLASPLAVSAPASGVAAAATALSDDDLIEKEWVSKAKRIVEQTRDDPYKQSENLTVFKADYLKQRYGKSIKLSQ
jgi:hypothetical protein